LTRDDLHLRVQTYPQYIERITGLTADQFIATLDETRPAHALLRHFVETVFDGTSG
jgi:hypothetical protein